MIIKLTIAATAILLTSSAALAAGQSREDRLVACLVGQGAVSLHQQIGTKVEP
jgi:hypothetical protein